MKKDMNVQGTITGRSTHSVPTIEQIDKVGRMLDAKPLPAGYKPGEIILWTAGCGGRSQLSDTTDAQGN